MSTLKTKSVQSNPKIDLAAFAGAGTLLTSLPAGSPSKSRTPRKVWDASGHPCLILNVYEFKKDKVNTGLWQGYAMTLDQDGTPVFLFLPAALVITNPATGEVTRQGLSPVFAELDAKGIPVAFRFPAGTELSEARAIPEKVAGSGKRSNALKAKDTHGGTFIMPNRSGKLTHVVDGVTPDITSSLVPIAANHQDIVSDVQTILSEFAKLGLRVAK